MNIFQLIHGLKNLRECEAGRVEINNIPKNPPVLSLNLSLSNQTSSFHPICEWNFIKSVKSHLLGYLYQLNENDTQYYSEEQISFREDVFYAGINAGQFEFSYNLRENIFCQKCNQASLKKREETVLIFKGLQARFSIQLKIILKVQL